MLVAAAQGGTTTHSAQDLVAPLSQILQLRQDSSTTSYVYGHERLVGLNGVTQTWYDHDALGSLRQTLDARGAPLSALHYDPWGVPQGSATPPTFGFTGELQEPGGLVYLRARWYHAGRGTFPSRDPYPGVAPVPASLHPYQYAHANPVTWTDPTGTCLGWLWGDPDCQFAGADYRSYDYAGAGQVIVTGLGGAATVVACAGTAGAACVAGAAGAAAVTSWGQQALANAGRPVWQAATGVSWRRVGVDAAVGGVSGPLGAGTGRVAQPFVQRITSAGLQAMARGSLVGSVSAGAGRLFNNVLDGDTRTRPLDGMVEHCLVGGLAGALAGGVEVKLRARLNLAHAPNVGEASHPTFYVRSNGDIIPATGYRYISSEAPYLDDLLQTGNIPANLRGTYLSFDKIDDIMIAHGRLQVPHDAAIRVEFDTRQILEDVRIPHGNWQQADYLEPLTRDFPEFGPGGATQAITNQPIQVRRIIDLRTGEVLYERP